MLCVCMYNCHIIHVEARGHLGCRSPGVQLPELTKVAEKNAFRAVRTSGKFPIFLKEKDIHDLKVMLFLFPTLILQLQPSNSLL